jgi:SPP1 gp7 family putative phage head morphogenesis protein
MKKRKLQPTFNADLVVPVYVVNPFVSEAQRRACYAADDPNWDCEEWEAATDGKRLPARKAAKKRKGKLKANRGPVGNAKRKPNPLKYDPTRTLTLRRSFCAQLRRQFAILKGRIVKLIVDEDALGLKESITNSAQPDPETALEQRLIRIAKEAYRRKREEGSPDYGQLFFKSETQEVWYCGADGDTSELFDWLEPLLEEAVGDGHVTIEAEAYPPRDEGWVQLFPKRKPVTTNFNPDQPRDEHGRFGEGGGQSDSHLISSGLLDSPKDAWKEYSVGQAMRMASRGEEVEGKTNSSGHVWTAEEAAGIREAAARLQEEAASTNSGHTELLRGEVHDNTTYDPFEVWGEGKVVEINGLQAVTPHRDVADTYTDPQFLGDVSDYGQLIIHYSNPKGITGANVDQAETVLPHGAKYVVHRTSFEYDGMYHVYLVPHETTKNFNPDQPRDASGRFGFGGSGPSTETSGRYSPKAPDAPKGSLLARMKSSVSSRLPPWVQRWTAKLTKAAFILPVLTNKAIQAVAKERGLSPERVAKLSKMVGTVDVTTGGSRAAGVAAAVGLGALALPASLVPWGSVSYLAYSTARNPLATLRAARNGIQSAVRKLKGSKTTVPATNESSTHNVSQSDIEVIEAALSAHDYSDWYISLLYCALDNVPNDVHEAIALADAAHEDQLEDTSFPQEDDGEAVFGKDPPTANEGWVTLESGQRVFIGPKGEFSPSGPAESWGKGKSGKGGETGGSAASGGASSVGTCQVHTDSLKHLVSTDAPPVHVDTLSKQLGLQFQSVGTDPEYGDALYQVSFHPTTNRNELLAKLKSSGWDVVRMSSDRLTTYPVAKRPLPDTVYHWVPSSAVDSVLRDGILPGDRDRSSKLAGEWATHGAGKVFLSGTEGGGRWGKIFAGRLHEDMVLLRVDTKGLDTPAYHDNASQPRSGRMSIDNEAMWIQGVSIPASRLTVAGVHSHADDKFAANYHQPELGMLVARMVNYLDEDQVKGVTENFDPDQARDEHGRWSKDGGGLEGATLMPPMAAPKSRAAAADKVATRKEAAAVKAKSKAAEAKDKAKQAAAVAKQAAKTAVAARRSADKATKLAGKAKDKLESAKAKLAAASTPKAKAQAKTKVAEAKADADRTKKEAAKAEREAKKAEKGVASAVTKRDREAMKARTEEEKAKDATADAKEARAEAKRAAKEEKQSTAGPKTSSGGKTKAGETAMQKLARLQAAGTARREADEKAKRDAEPVLTPGQHLTRDQITARLDRLVPLPDMGHYTYFDKLQKRHDEVARIIDETAVKSSQMSVHGMSHSEEMRTVHVDGVAVHIAEGVHSRVVGKSLVEVLAGRMPQKLWEATDRIVFSTQDNKDDDHWRRTYANWSDKDKSVATGGDGTICVYGGQVMNHTTWAHESGHNLAYKTFGSTFPAHGSEYEVAQRQERPITTYGTNSAAEDFAESCMAYASRAETAASYKEKLKRRETEPLLPLAYHTKLKHNAPLKFAAIARIMGEDPHAPGTINRLLGNTRWKFTTDPDKVKAFQQWMTEQLDATLLSSSQEAQWRAYIEAGYRKGAGRAFDDGKAAARGQQTLDYYAGTRDEFLRSTFAQPVSVERVKLLAGRSYDDLENVTADMSTRMSRSLVDGLIQGKSPHEIAGNLSDDLDLSRSRAETIARTEVIRAHAEGQLDSMQQLGVDAVGVQVEWLATEDGNQCEDCSDLEGTVLSVDDARGMLPRHPNCRCCWMPALGDLAANRSVVRNAKDYGSGRWITLEDSGQHVFISGEGEFLPKGPGSGKETKEDKAGGKVDTSKQGDSKDTGGKTQGGGPGKPQYSTISRQSVRDRLKAGTTNEEREAIALEILNDHARPPKKLKALTNHGMDKSEDMHHVEIDGVQFHFPSAPGGARLAAQSLAKIFSVGKIPDAIWSANRHVVFTSQKCSFNDEDEQKMGITGFSTDATAGVARTVCVFPPRGVDKRLFGHESAHNLAEKLGWPDLTPPKNSPYGRAQKLEDPVTQYGATHPAEDFAEACGWMTIAPKDFRAKFPHKAAALDKLLGTART